MWPDRLNANTIVLVVLPPYSTVPDWTAMPPQVQPITALHLEHSDEASITSEVEPDRLSAPSSPMDVEIQQGPSHNDTTPLVDQDAFNQQDQELSLPVNLPDTSHPHHDIDNGSSRSHKNEADDVVDLTLLYTPNHQMGTSWALADDPGSDVDDADADTGDNQWFLDEEDDYDNVDVWDHYARETEDGLSLWDKLGAGYKAEFADIGMDDNSCFWMLVLIHKLGR